MRAERFSKNIVICKDWAAITREFERLPKPIWRRDHEGEANTQGWIFRGHKRETCILSPTIERTYPYSDWPEVERKILMEFQAKARLHLPAQYLPQLTPTSTGSRLYNTMEHQRVYLTSPILHTSPYILRCGSAIRGI